MTRARGLVPPLPSQCPGTRGPSSSADPTRSRAPAPSPWRGSAAAEDYIHPATFWDVFSLFKKFGLLLLLLCMRVIKKKNSAPFPPFAKDFLLLCHSKRRWETAVFAGPEQFSPRRSPPPPPVPRRSCVCVVYQKSTLGPTVTGIGNSFWVGEPPGKTSRKKKKK